MNVLISFLYLESWFENPSEVCHPEPLGPAGAERRPDRVFENLIDTEEGENARLEVRHPHLFRHCSA